MGAAFLRIISRSDMNEARQEIGYGFREVA